MKSKSKCVLVRFNRMVAVALALLMMVAAPVMAGIIITGTGTTSSSSTNGYGDPSSSQNVSFGLPGSQDVSNSHGTSNGNSNGSGNASLTSLTGPGGVVTITASTSSSAFAQDFSEQTYAGSGAGNLLASIQLTSPYSFVLTGSGSAATGGSGTLSATSSINFNGNTNSTTGGPFGLSASGILGVGTYGLAVDSNSSAAINDFFNASGSGNSEASLTLEFTPVPEPTSMFLLGAGLLSVAAWKWRRRVKQAPTA